MNVKKILKRKKGNLEDCRDAAIQRLEEYTKKQRETNYRNQLQNLNKNNLRVSS